MIKLNDISSGFYLYKNAITKEDMIVEKIENFINSSEMSIANWMPALVGYNKRESAHRSCFDFKLSKDSADNLPEKECKEIKEAYYSSYNAIQKYLTEYCNIYKLKMNFMEAINFVKYDKEQHFGVHSDHGFSYVCTVSSVLYLNDDYEGGELHFPYFNYTLKPEFGDIVFFPSSYLFAHQSLPVTKGTKYSAVTMFDYQAREEYKRKVLKR